jgi:hypothetical protein
MRNDGADQRGNFAPLRRKSGGKTVRKLDLVVPAR